MPSTIKELSRYMAEHKMPYSMDKIIPERNKWQLICEFHHGPFMVFQDTNTPDYLYYLEDGLESKKTKIHLIDAITMVKSWWNSIKD